MLSGLQSTSINWVWPTRCKPNRDIPSFRDSSFGNRTISQVTVSLVRSTSEWIWASVSVHSSYCVVNILRLHQTGSHHANWVHVSPANCRIWHTISSHGTELILKEILLSLILHLNFLNILKVSIQVSLQRSRVRVLPLMSLHGHQILMSVLGWLVTVSSSSYR